MRKRISRETVRGLPWYVGLWATIGASVDAAKHEPRRFCGIANEDLLNSWSATELAYLTLIGERARPAELFAFQVLTGLLISNAVGSISAQGCKGAVSSDGPETPSRVQINKAMMGFSRTPATRTAARATRGSSSLPSSSANRSQGSVERGAWPGPQGDGEALRRAVRKAEDRAQGIGRRAHARDRRTQPPGVPRQAGEPGPARGVHPRALPRARRVQRVPRVLPRARARCSRPASRGTSSASTSTA